jgi:hypothetical protein
MQTKYKIDGRKYYIIEKLLKDGRWNYWIESYDRENIYAYAEGANKNYPRDLFRIIIIRPNGEQESPL